MQYLKLLHKKCSSYYLGLLDLRNAAKAAVAGDPAALDLFTNLDMFTSWRPKTEGGKDNTVGSVHSDSQSFYAASSSGINFIRQK